MEDALDSIHTYTGAAGYRINRLLREHKGNVSALSDDDQIVVQELDMLFQLVPATTSSMTVWRDMDIEMRTHKQYGFVSTSTNNDHLTSSHPGAEVQCCQYQIHVPAGAKVLPLFKWSVHPNENEVLLPRNSVFKYTGRQIKGGTIWIFLDLILKEQQQEELLDLQEQQQTAHNKHVSEVAALIVDQLNQGQIQRELAEENELFEMDTTLEEFVQQKVAGLAPADVDEIMQLINLTNYS